MPGGSVNKGTISLLFLHFAHDRFRIIVLYKHLTLNISLLRFKNKLNDKTIAHHLRVDLYIFLNHIIYIFSSDFFL